MDSYKGQSGDIRTAFVPRSFLWALVSVLLSLLVSPAFYAVIEIPLIKILSLYYIPETVEFLSFIFYMASYPLVSLFLYVLLFHGTRLVYMKFTESLFR
jgi:hypothetical protein